MNTSSRTKSAPPLDIIQFQLDYREPDAQPSEHVSWQGGWSGIADRVRVLGGGSDRGAVVVRLSVDGQIDEVEADLNVDPVAAIDQVIGALTIIREGLAAIPNREVGPCPANGDWGPCRGTFGHEEGHRFPTESDALERIQHALG